MGKNDLNSGINACVAIVLDNQEMHAICLHDCKANKKMTQECTEQFKCLLFKVQKTKLTAEHEGDNCVYINEVAQIPLWTSWYLW